jgi:hypothetical protein
MQLHLLAAATLLAGLTAPLPVRAQIAIEPFCFIEIDERTIDLTSMCIAQPVLTAESLASASDDSALVYGDAYCEAKAQGRTNRQARATATESAAEYIVSNRLPRSIITPQWIEAAQENSRTLCPELQPRTRYN